MTLQEIYQQLPTIECKGLCYDSCGFIPVLPAEWAKLRARTPKGTFEKGDELVILWDNKRQCCPHLDRHRRCSVYADRPLICRAWGLVRDMPCTFGCQPSRWLSNQEYAKLQDQIAEIDLTKCT